MNTDERENITQVLESAIEQLQREVNWGYDAEVSSWIEIYKDILGERGLGPRRDADNSVWFEHLKSIKPYLIVYGIERAQSESIRLRMAGR